MHSELEVRETIRSWVLAKAKDLDSASLTDKTPLFEDRHLRSLHLPEQLLLLEKLCGEEIDVSDLQAGDFRDIDTLVKRFISTRAPS